MMVWNARSASWARPPLPQGLMSSNLLEAQRGLCKATPTLGRISHW